MSWRYMEVCCCTCCSNGTFFMVFVSAYHNEVQMRSKLEMDNAILAAQSERAKIEIFALHLILSSFAAKAKQQNVAFSAEVNITAALPL